MTALKSLISLKFTSSREMMGVREDRKGFNEVIFTLLKLLANFLSMEEMSAVYSNQMLVLII